MQKLNKTAGTILSTRYKTWISKVDTAGKNHNSSYTYYYDDVVMNLYRCQAGVCAYTEMPLCKPSALYDNVNWIKGRYKFPTGYVRTDHLGELDHFDPDDKHDHYWNWENLFMIEAKINSHKSNWPIITYLKPDLPDYEPEKYFDYDEETHRYLPNTDIDDRNIANEIQYMIDKVLYLNHGTVRNERQDYINVLKDKKARGEMYEVSKFFTAVRWVV